MSFKEIVDLALNAIKESVEEDLSKETIRIAYVKSSEDNKFKICTKDEINKFIIEL